MNESITCEQCGLKIDIGYFCRSCKTMLRAEFGLEWYRNKVYSLMQNEARAYNGEPIKTWRNENERQTWIIKVEQMALGHIKGIGRIVK